MSFKGKIATLALALVLAVGAFSVGTCGRNHYAASSRAELVG